MKSMNVTVTVHLYLHLLDRPKTVTIASIKRKINCINVAKKIYLPKPIFSPLSGGKLNPSTVMNEIRIHGNIKLTLEKLYNILNKNEEYFMH
jgi:hypothetical protein